MPRLRIQSQPDDTTCGPTSLHAVYAWYGDDIPLEQVIGEVKTLYHGGTQLAFLGVHALRRGYHCRMYIYNLNIFDPTWFEGEGANLAAKLRLQAKAKDKRRLHESSAAYLEYLRLGGEILREELTPRLLCGFLRRRVPILTGLCATHLYGCSRERTSRSGVLVFDDVKGYPMGHFVVLTGCDARGLRVSVADPWPHNPLGRFHYRVGMTKLINSILLGVLTYDGNLLIIEKK